MEGWRTTTVTSLPILQSTRARPPHGEGPHANSTQIRASGVGSQKKATVLSHFLLPELAWKIKTLLTTIVHLIRALSWNLCELTPIVAHGSKWPMVLRKSNGQSVWGNEQGSFIRLEDFKPIQAYIGQEKDSWCSWIICTATCGVPGETCLFETTMKPPLGKNSIVYSSFLAPKQSCEGTTSTKSWNPESLEVGWGNWSLSKN